MNLVHGTILNADERQYALEGLEQSILQTLAKPGLNLHTVINACDALSQALSPQHTEMLCALGVPKEKAEIYVIEAKEMLSKNYLVRKLCVELGEQYLTSQAFHTSHTSQLLQPNQIHPLGVLFHIAAGNMDGLPFYTVIEGLLVGNINILKLPQQESGLSILVFQELFQYAPELAEYVYVFDFTSDDKQELKQLADVSDGIVVWGGDETIVAARRMANPNTKIIEWGHKLSFAYATQEGMYDEEALHALATHITQTDQLLCSSCQGVYLDTGSMDTVYEFCERFLPILHAHGKQTSRFIDIGLEAQIGLQLQNAQLETIYNQSKVYKSDTCSIIAYQDQTLSPSFMFRNCWVKRLPRADVLPVLKPYKGHLQTVGLLCAPTERTQLAALFYRSGAVRVTGAGTMSAMIPTEAHDGEYPLRRYTKVVSYML